jgi:magnesium transporter
MGIVAATVYANGVRVRTLSLDEPAHVAVGPHEFAWIGLVDPDEAELRKLQARFKLHPLAVDDALVQHPLPKVSVYGDQVFVVARTAWLEDDRIVYGETCAFLWANHIITVRSTSVRAHAELRQNLEAAPALLSHGIAYVLYAMLDFIVDGYAPIVEDIEEEVLAMERRALDAFLSREDVTRLFNLRRELMRFRRGLAPMEEVAARLEHLHVPFLDAEVRPYFRDVGDHIRRVASATEGLRDVLSSVFDVSNLFEQQRQGEITRQLAAWAAILAVPTAVAGIYGMNFEDMPELHWQYGYFVVLAAVVFVCVMLFVQFKRVKWL